MSSTDVARRIVSALVAHGVTDVIVCPGSRDAPLSYALAAADEAGMGDGTAKEESFFDRVTSTAKNIGESVSSAARETRNSESFEKAREDFTTAFNETREGVQGAINNAKEQRAEGKHAQQPQNPGNPYAPKQNNDVIDGEVVDEN